MSANPVEEWIEKAEDNYTSALTLARRKTRRVPDVVCNQCQQCAEKYLKALLVRHKVVFPKVHDLPALRDLVAKIEPNVRLIEESLDLLNPYGIDIRYPGLRATDEDAKIAIKAMSEVRRFVRAKLGLRTK